MVLRAGLRRPLSFRRVAGDSRLGGRQAGDGYTVWRAGNSGGSRVAPWLGALRGGLGSGQVGFLVQIGERERAADGLQVEGVFQAAGRCEKPPAVGLALEQDPKTGRARIS